MSDFPQMTLSQHFQEFKSRLITSLILSFICVVLCYFVADRILDFLLKPLITVFSEQKLDRHLIYTSLTEPFLTKIRIALTTSMIMIFPVICWHCYRFIAPGLFRREKLTVLTYMISCPLLFLFGSYLAYAYVIPLAWKFFISFEQEFSSTIPLILETKISEYISLVTTMIVAFGLTFQLPLLLVLLVQVNLISYQSLKTFRKYAVVLIFIIAALVTPPDVISQIMLAIPLLLLYEISILICKRIKIKSPEI